MRRTMTIVIAILCLVAGLGLLLKPAAQAGKDAPPLTLTGDGVTDNTEAIRQLLQRDGTITFPRGVFRFVFSWIIPVITPPVDVGAKLPTTSVSIPPPLET